MIEKSKRGLLFEVLSIGLDCRSEGIIWIIEKLWTLGEKVYENHLPQFLDNKAKDFLISVYLKLKESKKKLRFERIKEVIKYVLFKI